MAKQKTSRSLDAQAKLRQSVNTVLAALLCILIGLLVGLVVLFISASSRAASMTSPTASAARWSTARRSS